MRRLQHIHRMNWAKPIADPPMLTQSIQIGPVKCRIKSIYPSGRLVRGILCGGVAFAKFRPVNIITALEGVPAGKYHVSTPTGVQEYPTAAPLIRSAKLGIGPVATLYPSSPRFIQSSQVESSRILSSPNFSCQSYNACAVRTRIFRWSCRLCMNFIWSSFLSNIVFPARNLYP